MACSSAKLSFAVIILLVLQGAGVGCNPKREAPLPSRPLEELVRVSKAPATAVVSHGVAASAVPGEPETLASVDGAPIGVEEESEARESGGAEAEGEAGAPESVEAECTRPGGRAISGNPTGEFANVLIRGSPTGEEAEGNTWAALQEAARAGYRYVEVDIVITSDAFVIPARLDNLRLETTDCTGSILGSTLADVVKCHHRDGKKTPVKSLDVALEGTHFRGVYLDIKPTRKLPLAPLELVVEAIRRFVDRPGMRDVVVAMSYDDAVTRALLAAGIRTATKGYPGSVKESGDFVRATARLGAEMTCLEERWLDRSVYDRATELGIWILPWRTWDSDINARYLKALIDGRAGGLINGTPELVEELLAAYCFD